MVTNDHVENVEPIINLQPSYVEFFTESIQYFVRTSKSLWTTDNWQYQLNHNLKQLAAQVQLYDILLIVVLSLGLTLARHCMAEYVCKPIITWRGIPTNEAKKIPESMWKCLFYLTTWIAASVIIFGDNKAQYFRYPERVWQNYSLQTPVEGSIYTIYALELSFYIHSLYSTLQLDQRRKDTYTLLIHHVLCVFLISVSYCNKSFKSGLLTLFLHDGCDVLLEATKLVRYFKVQHGHTYGWMEGIVNVGFGCFLVSWILNRMYWFPLKQIYMASIYVEAMAIPVPFISLLVTMLWLILLMNFYWFSFAVRLLFRVATGQLTELEDNREYNKNSDSEDETLNEKVANDEQRKMSVDSGVVMLGDNESGHHSSEEEQLASISKVTIEPTGIHSTEPNNTGYNLRHRRGVNFALFR